MIKNLIFSGGGVKTISYAGAVIALEEKKVMQDIQKVGGTSGGAISALCVSLGYNASELAKKLFTLDFNKFSDQQISFSSYISMLSVLSKLFATYGINSGTYFKEFLTTLITEKHFNKDITFKELHDSSTTGIDLYVVCVNLNRQCPQIFSYDTTPDESVLEAVLASGSMPLYFKPVKNTHNSEMYVDGGVIYNYPIQLFDHMQDSKVTSYSLPVLRDSTNDETLGFTPTNKKALIAHQEGVMPEVCCEINNLWDFVKAVGNVWYNADLYHAFDNEDRTVFIDDANLMASDFNLTEQQKINLILSGYKETIGFLNKHSIIDDKLNTCIDDNLETSLIGNFITAETA